MERLQADIPKLNSVRFAETDRVARLMCCTPFTAPDRLAGIHFIAQSISRTLLVQPSSAGFMWPIHSTPRVPRCAVVHGHHGHVSH